MRPPRLPTKLFSGISGIGDRGLNRCPSGVSCGRDMQVGVIYAAGILRHLGMASECNSCSECQSAPTAVATNAARRTLSPIGARPICAPRHGPGSEEKKGCLTMRIVVDCPRATLIPPGDKSFRSSRRIGVSRRPHRRFRVDPIHLRINDQDPTPALAIVSCQCADCSP
jgi:hypothetical protein